MKNKTNNVKITDFGLAKFVDEEGLTAVQGTPAYMSPELLRGDEYGFAVDNYAFGIMLWEIWSQCIPYEGLETSSDLEEVVAVREERPDISLLPSDCPHIVVSCMESLWKNDPALRMDGTTAMMVHTIPAHTKCRRHQVRCNHMYCLVGVCVCVPRACPNANTNACQPDVGLPWGGCHSIPCVHVFSGWQPTTNLRH